MIPIERTLGPGNDGGCVSDKILHLLASICGTDEVRTDPDQALYEREVLDLPLNGRDFTQLAVVVALILMYGRGDFSTPSFVYQAF